MAMRMAARLLVKTDDDKFCGKPRPMRTWQKQRTNSASVMLVHEAGRNFALAATAVPPRVETRPPTEC